MRNLKKILAMVLALVMSLSLMATAGAANFTDASSINEKYETAIEVLEGLGVFKGYDENGSYSFKPTGEITRAETAAIIYRIVTGDVTDSQVGIYADYNLFTDVPSTSWYAGYVNFCANAEYIKGVGGGKFDPSSRVTGYAALAMILRAIGYTANGGFTGPDWEVQTARTAEARKITKNIMTGTLGQPATRETVAEILFQAILVNMVDHNVLNTLNGNQGYTETDITLGYKTFKLEQIEGVVTGNEFADLKSTQVLDEGETQLETEDGVRDLAITTEITDIGESRYAYITGTKVLAMGDTGLNKITEFGNACEIDTVTKFNAAAEMPAASDIEYYVNFGRVGTYDCDQRLEFNVTFYSRAAENSFDGYAGVDISWVAAHDSDWTVTSGADTDADGDIDSDDTWVRVVLGANDDYADVVGYAYTGANAYRYTKIIRANDEITQTDLDILRGIFGAADNVNNNILPQDYITGDVFVGTMSTNSAATNEERDLSNTISYNKFFADYINPIDYNQNWNSSDNGEWVKFIDNDADGKADYAFRTDSWLDEAIDTYTNKDGDTVTAFATFTDDDTNVPNGATKVRYMDGEVPAVGTKVICALIDNQILVEPANHDNVTVTDYNWRTDVITTDNGDYGQSGIGYAELDLQYFINTMDMKTEYIVYLDHFGYVRAYELPGETTYALVTEIYARNNANGNLVRDWPMTVELTVKDADTTEYSLNGGSGNLFVSPNWWTQVSNYASVGNYYNWLKPAVAHLGVAAATGWGPTLAADVDLNPVSYSFWPRNRQVAYDVDSMTKNDTFDYGPVNGRATIADGAPGGPVNTSSTSFTNVAVVNINGETATLEGAAKLRLDGFGNVMRWDSNNDGIVGNAGDLARYTVDYVQLTKANTVDGQTRYPIDTVNYTGWIGNAANNYVSATHDTEYYIVYNGGVYYFTDYTKMPKLTMADNNIHAAYAVARDTSADNANEPYWVADVIVYEVENWIDTSKTSTALVYYNPSRNDAQIQRLNVLDSDNGKVDAIPDDIGWNSNLGYFNNFANYSGLGFYQFWDGEMQENGDLAVGDIVFIDGTDYRGTGTHGNADLRFNSNLIYAGTVVNEVDVATRGTYLNVDTDGDGNTNVSLLVKNSDESNVYSVTTDDEVGSRWTYNEATALRYNNIRTSEIKAGDRIVWIGTAAINPVGSNNTQSAAFVVDLGNGINNNGIYSTTAAFLGIHPVPTSAVPDPDPAVLSGINPLWLQIMTEQAATKTQNDITINAVVLPDGTDGDNDVLGITVTPNKINLDVTTEAITFGNLGAYEIDKVKVLNAVGSDPAAVAAIDGTTWKLFNIKGDVQLQITLKDAPAAPGEGHTITVKYIGITAGQPAGVTVPADKTFTVEDGKDWLVSASEIEIDIRGYNFSKVTDDATGTGTTISPILGGNYGLANVTSDQTISAVYTTGTYSLNVITSNGGTNGLTGVAAINYSVTPVGGTASNSATFNPLNTAVQGTNGQAWAGASYTLTFAGNSLYTYTATATNGTASISRDGDNWTVTGEINGATTVTITETKGSVATIKTSASTAGTIAFTTPAGGTSPLEVLPTDTVKFTVAPDTDTAITAVTYQISGQTAVPIPEANIEKAADGKWTVTLPDEAKVAGDITTISATAISTANVEVTFTVGSGWTGEGLAYKKNGVGNMEEITNSGKVTVKPGDTLVITGNKALKVTETTGTTVGPVINPVDGGTAVTVTIPNTTTDFGLTIVDMP